MVAALMGRRFPVGGIVGSHHVAATQSSRGENFVLLWTCDDGVVWTSLGPLPRWVPGPTTRWAPGTTRLALHGT
jgi:hypothetical protein